MFVGHFGVSFAAKAAEPRLPLWGLFLAVQLPDFIWGISVALGFESVKVIPGIVGLNPLDQYYMPYSHSLAAALLLCGGFVVYVLFNGNKSVHKPLLVLGMCVVSHWVLDFVVRHPEEILFAGGSRSSRFWLGFVISTFVLEALLLTAGIIMYLRSSAPTSPSGKYATAAFALIMLAVQARVFFGSRPETQVKTAILAFACYLVFAAIGIWVDRQRRPAVEATSAAAAQAGAL